MLIDFHTHTAASDGALSPADLLARAGARGVGMLAITDHDTVAGYRAAAAMLAGQYTQSATAMRLVPGIEFSCRWSGSTVHILGLGIDCDHRAMREGVAALESARAERGRIIGQRLEALGFGGALEGALAEAGDSLLGRPHFSAWLVASGHVPDHHHAFGRYLGRGKAGDVKACWPELPQVVGWINGAGGVAVIAHPLKYGFTRMKLHRLVGDFIAAGGAAIEIASGNQTRDQLGQLRRLAAEYALEVSVGSDFHRDGPYHPPPGIEIPRLDGLTGVWERWTESPSATAGNVPR